MFLSGLKRWHEQKVEHQFVGALRKVLEDGKKKGLVPDEALKPLKELEDAR